MSTVLTLFKPRMRIVSFSKTFGNTSCSKRKHVSGPGVPVIQEASGQSTSSIRVLWQEPFETNGVILSYEIDLSPIENRADGKRSYVAEDTERYYIFRELDSDTTHLIQIRANTTKGFGNWSSVANATTLTQRKYNLTEQDYTQMNFVLSSVVPGAPQNLSASAGDMNIALSWDHSRLHPPRTYKIIYLTVNGNEKHVENITHTQRVITGLRPFTEYVFEVKGEVQGANSSTIRVWTREGRK